MALASYSLYVKSFQIVSHPLRWISFLSEFFLGFVMFFNLYDSMGHSEQKSLGASEAHFSHGTCKSALLIACAIGENPHLWR